MFSFIKGEVIVLSDSLIAVLAGGVGYEVNISRKCSVKTGEDVTMHIHLIHKEDSMKLYGFKSREEKNIFLTLISAQGIGAKLAMETISTYSVEEIIEILFKGDINRLKKVSGMGSKKAEKLLFELKDKIEKTNIDTVSSKNFTTKESDAVKALISLGFSNTEANTAVSKIDSRENMGTEQIIAFALRNLSIL